MNVWIIEPHDPLIFRDGKPFGPTPGVRATSLPFPFPSTTTGGVRTQVGLDEQGMFTLTSTDELKQLKKLAVRGPLLVQLTPEGTIKQWLLPAPADAVLFEPDASKEKESTDKDTHKVERLLPQKNAKHAMTDLDTQRPDLALVGFKESNRAKPAKEAPLYWYWDNFKNWLETPATFLTEPAQLGLRGLPRELRTHVAMDSETRTGKDGALFDTYGALFDTSGMEFTGVDKARHLSQAQRLALAVITDDPREIRQTLGSFGGERRIVSWRKNENNAAIQCCPNKIQERIFCERACRLILLTPAYFEQGSYPTWLLEEREGIKPKLKAIAIQRPQVVSGWDIAQHSPKPARRLAPAGTVLFLELDDNKNEAALNRVDSANLAALYQRQ